MSDLMAHGTMICTQLHTCLHLRDGDVHFLDEPHMTCMVEDSLKRRHAKHTDASMRKTLKLILILI